MIGIYFSGSGNTKHCIEQFVHQADPSAPCISIEEKTIVESMKDHDQIVLAYPVYFSNFPKIVRDFLVAHRAEFAGKSIFILATMGLFSGDGGRLCSKAFIGIRCKNHRRFTFENAGLHQR